MPREREDVKDSVNVVEACSLRGDEAAELDGVLCGDEPAVGLVPEEGVEAHDRDEIVLERDQHPEDERDVRPVHFEEAEGLADDPKVED